MKRLFLAVLVVLLCTQAFGQPLGLEGSFGVVFPRFTGVVSGDNSISLQDLGVTSQTTLKQLELGAALSPDLRIRYIGILPVKESGKGILAQQLILNGIPYGPQSGQTGGNNTQNKEINVEYAFWENRLECDFLPLLKQPSYQMHLIGALNVPVISVTVKGVSQSTNSSSSNMPVEATVTANRALIGLGIGGFQRTNNVLIRYKVLYNFGNQSRGWTTEIDLRYESLRIGGFVEGGYFAEDLNVPFDTLRFQNKLQGGVVRVGMIF